MDAPGELLTDRESEVARLAAEGLSLREIGEQLNISANTVKTYLEHVHRKLGVRNRVQMTRFCWSLVKITRTGD